MENLAKGLKQEKILVPHLPTLHFLWLIIEKLQFLDYRRQINSLFLFLLASIQQCVTRPWIILGGEEKFLQADYDEFIDSLKEAY